MSIDPSKHFCPVNVTPVVPRETFWHGLAKMAHLAAPLQPVGWNVAYLPCGALAQQRDATAELGAILRRYGRLEHLNREPFILDYMGRDTNGHFEGYVDLVRPVAGGRPGR